MRVAKNPADFLPNPRRYVSNYSLAVSTAKLFVPGNTLVFITARPSSSPGSGSGSGLGSEFGEGEALESVAGVMAGVEIPNPERNLTEPIYNTSYSYIDIPRKLLLYWSYNQTLPLTSSNEHLLYLPGPNNFIPSSLELLPSDEKTTPTLLPDDNGSGSENWYLQDTLDFPQPKVNVRCELRPASFQNSSVWAAHSRLAVSLLLNVLQPTLFGATEVGYDYNVIATERGLILTFSGLSDMKIMQQIINTTISSKS